MNRYNRIVRLSNRLIAGDETIDAKILLEEVKAFLEEETEDSPRFAVLSERAPKIEAKIHGVAA